MLWCIEQVVHLFAALLAKLDYSSFFLDLCTQFPTNQLSIVENFKVQDISGLIFRCSVHGNVEMRTATNCRVCHKSIPMDEISLANWYFLPPPLFIFPGTLIPFFVFYEPLVLK